MKKRSHLMVLSLAIIVSSLIFFIGMHSYTDFSEYKAEFSQKERIQRANSQIRSMLPLWKLVSKQLLPQG
jgi:hypothetical protein